MGAELLERSLLRPFAKQVEVEVAEHPAVPIRVVDLQNVLALVRDAKAVVGRCLHRVVRQHNLEEPVLLTPPHRSQLARLLQAEVDARRRRLQRAHDDPAAVLGGMGAEQREGITMPPFDEGGEHAVVSDGLHGAIVTALM
jgi:hypothetical protein